MRIERLVGLYVTNDEIYKQYRKGMLPILERFGGGFSYDFKIHEVLKSDVKKINRVFIIYFKYKESMNLFFADKEYLDIVCSKKLLLFCRNFSFLICYIDMHSK